MSYQWRVSLYVVIIQNIVYIRERETSYCLVRSPYRPWNFIRDDLLSRFTLTMCYFCHLRTYTFVVMHKFIDLVFICSSEETVECSTDGQLYCIPPNHSIIQSIIFSWPLVLHYWLNSRSVNKRRNGQLNAINNIQINVNWNPCKYLYLFEYSLIHVSKINYLLIGVFRHVRGLFDKFVDNLHKSKTSQWIFL